MKTSLILFLLLFPLISWSVAWHVNKDHSEILFQVTYMNVSELTGRFQDFNGKMEMDANGGPVSMEVNITSKSIDTGNKMRDGHLKDNDFLQSDYYPVITFKSTSVKKIKSSHYRVSGPLTIKGKTKTTEFDVMFSPVMKDTWGYENTFVKFTSKLNRKDFNIVWNKTLDGQQFLVGDEITVKGTFQMQPESAKTPNSKHMIPDTDAIRERDLKRRKEESSFSRKLRSIINGN